MTFPLRTTTKSLSLLQSFLAGQDRVDGYIKGYALVPFEIFSINCRGGG